MNSSARCFRALFRHDRERDALGLDRRHGLVLGALEPAVDSNERRRADLDVHVGSAALHGVAQQLIEIQHLRPPSLRGSTSS
jgi:hypothetical protein